MNMPVKPPVAVVDAPLYESAKKNFPQSVHGRFRSIKWVLMAVFLGIYYLLPFVRWDRGPNSPSQAVLVDLPNTRFYFFFIELWPQEVYYFTGLLVIAAMTLFLMNAVAGRIWCGYACPQTVWTDLFYAVERWIEGDRRERMKKDKAELTARRVGELVLKHGIWLTIAWWTGGAWVLYFADAPTLVKELATFQAPMIAYACIGVLTFTTYTLAGHMREQVCIYMCPWPRIQAALTDEWALNVTYRYDRGEPRTSIKKAADLRALGEKAGDCVDCLQCVAVCPTGVDIRHGSQLGCIQCGLCIDACDTVMAKIGRPSGLIAYDNDVNIARRLAGEAPVYRFIRARTLIYTGIIALVAGVMLYTLSTRTLIDINVLHDRNPLFVTLSDGSIRNAYTIRFLNKRSDLRTIELSASGVPIPVLHVIGEEPASRTIVAVGPDQTREVRVLVTVPPAASIQASNAITFTARDVDSGDRATARDHFFGP
ncbi:cytochrome c oxidase accessory protein CcoG [Rhodoplanes roseus]|uniref:Cytochrome c oxidase accessory protein CcoG n=1 Tax=Rhodoplanes roseus TaxID=29409 RepID=A0A327KZ80_9BRAD|nr:cytochrome c oxidase accessory protein CcoG [Rhodoplanes roseus]RAI43364.1 cytochrome c oxidase accessory protein CcoG [Rhodoplanes roseus]